MVTGKKFRALCLGLPDASEAPHFERAAFRTPKRIYATLGADEKSANLRLLPEQQEMLVTTRPKAFAPIDNAWGKQGWTVVTLADVDEATLKDALGWAHALAAVPPKKAPKKASKKASAKTK